jgi:hypothetical protein
MAIATMPPRSISSRRPLHLALLAWATLAAACASAAPPGDPGAGDEEVDAAPPVKTMDAAPRPQTDTGAPVTKPVDAAAPAPSPDAEEPPPADAGPVAPADAAVVPDPGSGEGRITDGLTQLLVSSGVGMGYYHACHLLASMDIKCYGDPLTHPRLRPPAVKSKQVACAHDGCCVLQPPEVGARLRCWSDKAPFFPPAEISKSVDPLQIGIGYNHDCVLNTDHTVKCWGQAATKFTPPAGLMAKSLAVAAFFTCAVAMDDSVVCWGLNPPPPPEGLKAKLIAATFHGTSKLEMANGAGETRHACAIKLDDTVTCWGDNVGGNTEVPADLGPVKDLAVATFNSCALQLDGTPVCWGTKLYDPSPARVHPMPKGLKLKAIKAKMASYCGLQLDDTLVCWGDSKTGHVSIPPGTKIYVP